MAEPHPTDDNVTAELPIDILKSEILPRLPAKSVGQFKSVCKQWLSFLSTQEFENMHRRHIATAASHKILLNINDGRSCSIGTIDCENPNYISTSMNPFPFKVRPPDVLILASLDGLVCVCLRNTCELVIWNPLTHAYKKLPNSKSYGFYKAHSDAVGLYIDSSNDYRVLHIKRRRGAMDVYTYSRRSDSWRKVRFLKKRQYHTVYYVWSSAIFSGDCLYFMVKQYWIGGETMIISFDVNSEKFKEISVPGVPRGASFQGNLVDVENRIHLFLRYGFLDWGLDLWRLDGEKWIRVAVFPGIQNVPWPWTLTTYVISNRKWLVLWDSGDVYEIDTKTKDYTCLHPGRWFHHLQGVLYIETVVSPNL